MDFRWRYPILSSYSWLDSFAQDHYDLDIDILIEFHDDAPSQYEWSSRHLNDLDCPQEVTNRAAALKALMDGGLFIIRGMSYSPMRFGQLIDENELARPIQEVDVLVEPFSATIIKEEFNKLPSQTSFSLVGRYIYQSRYDSLTRGILSFLGVNGISWVSLFAVKDYMRTGNWTEEQIAHAAGRSKSDVELFNHTANSPLAIGPFARHGDKGRLRPKEKMTLVDASRIILPAAQGFIIDRVRSKTFDLTPY